MIKLRSIIQLLILSLLISCGEQSETRSVQAPIHFQSGEECHVCGMVILRFAGPKGQAFDKRSKQMQKFCSTLDLLSWYLQPENKSNVQEIYVHDMAQVDWQLPDDTKLIDARKAFYVIGSNKKGSMGKTVASFANLVDAENFIKSNQGSVFNFKELTLENLIEI